MDSDLEARDYDAMDHRAVNERFVRDFLSSCPAARNILDVGTGTAQIPIEICRCATAAAAVAIDAARHMIDLGRNNVRRAGLVERIRLEVCDAKRLPFADAAFDAVVSNSIVHHIPRPQDVLAEMLRVAAPGGAIFVRDLVRPADQAALAQLVEQYAGSANDHQRRMFADSLHAALTLDEVRALVLALGFPAQSVQMTSDRHWTWAGVKLPAADQLQ